MIKNASSLQRVPLKHILGSDISSDALDLVNKLLLFNPMKRLNAEQALEHQYVSKFHDPPEENTMSSSVSIPLNDDIRLSIDDYRNKLYELITSHNHANYRISRTIKSNKIVQPVLSNEVKKRVIKTEQEKQHHCHYREKPCQIHSEPRLNSQPKVKTTNTRSDSKISKQIISFPSETNNISPFSGNLKKSVQQNDIKETHSRKKMNSKSNVYMSFNSYNPSHGIITQSALMELRAAGIR